MSDIYGIIEETARKEGFFEVFFTAPVKTEGWRKCADEKGLKNIVLFEDAKKAYPFAKCIILLMYPYEVFEEETHISPYYIASNDAYHKTNGIVSKIRELGFRAEQAHIPLRAVFLENGIGKMSKNGLLRYADYGSRIILFAIATDCVLPREFEVKPTMDCDKNCDACKNACPVTAISENGMEQRKCMRFYMDDVPYPDFVLDNIQHFMGCEICMYACRENANVKKRKVTEEEQAAFDLNNLADGNDKEARLMVGKNFTRHNKLQYEALNFIQREENKKET
ncbi:MAG: hypothetical protein IJF80_04140 [Clostridia bacterium]|nr:hypothetical protein [Clostridia bacterium]